MGSSNVNFPAPLTRLTPWYPGQFGVPGTDHETGLRMHSTGAVFYVDPNATGVSDARDGTDPTCPLQTVATALTKCQPMRGDTIAVMANSRWDTGNPADSYATAINESVTVTVPGVRIVGVCPSSPVGVCWTPATVDGVCITIDAVHVLVEGFAFLGRTGGTGVLIEWDGTDVYGDCAVIRNCYFYDELDEGIVMDFSYYTEIHDCWFDHPDEYGIYSSGIAGDPAYCLIHDNWFHDCGTGAIWLPGADRNHIYRNSIYNNDAATNDAGTTANCMINLTNGSRNQVHHNTLSCILPAAVAWDYNGCNTAGTGDAWMQNYLLNGPSTTNPT